MGLGFESIAAFSADPAFGMTDGRYRCHGDASLALFCWSFLLVSAENLVLFQDDDGAIASCELQWKTFDNCAARHRIAASVRPPYWWSFFLRVPISSVVRFRRLHRETGSGRRRKPSAGPASGRAL